MSSRNTRRGQQADDELQQGAEPAQGQPMQPAPAGGAAGTGWGLAIPPGANPPMPNPMPPPPAGAMMPPLPTFPAGQFNANTQQPSGLQQQQIWAAQQAAALAATRPLQMPPQQVLPPGMPAAGAAAAAAAAPAGSNPQGYIAQLYVCPQCHKGLKSQAGLSSHLQHCKPEKIHAEMMRNPQEKALRISTKRREKWELRYAELVEYKRRHRHCKVPANDPENLQLGRWVSATRREYKKRQSGQKNPLTDERVLKLHGIGFEFDVHTTNWEQKYEELCEFKDRHGHCNVPSTFKENQPLSIWVKRQREAHYKRFHHGKKVGMSDERIKALEAIDFDFSMDYTPIPRGKQNSWDERIQQLQAYKDTHGDCNVPRGKQGATEEEESLGNWVALCRTNYQKKVRVLTEERQKQLEDMGFVWRMKGRDMTPEERAQRKKERAEIELTRKVNREVRKRKLVAEDAEKKTSKKKAKASTSKKAATSTKVGKGKSKAKTKGSAKSAAAGTKPPRTYFGHVPKPTEDGGAPPLPDLPPGGWDTSDCKTRIEAARRAADYYSRLSQKWEEIAQEEEEAKSEVQAAAESELPVLGEAQIEMEETNASASEGYAADESEAVEAI